jgi:uncharacterized protein YgiB involved in biofilm formation
MQNESLMQSAASGMLKSFSKKYFTKRYLTAALTLALASGTVFFRYYTRNKVVSFENPIYILSALVPHGGYSETCVIAYGRFFNNVAGHKPYYLSSENCDRIVIYTNPYGNPRVANILKTNDSSVVSVVIPGFSTFGMNIGIKSRDYSERLECMSNNNIILINKSRYTEEIVTIDTLNASVNKREVIQYDGNGTITNRWNVR